MSVKVRVHLSIKRTEESTMQHSQATQCIKSIKIKITPIKRTPARVHVDEGRSVKVRSLSAAQINLLDGFKFNAEDATPPRKKRRLK